MYVPVCTGDMQRFFFLILALSLYRFKQARLFLRGEMIWQWLTSADAGLIGLASEITSCTARRPYGYSLNVSCNQSGPAFVGPTSVLHRARPEVSSERIAGKIYHPLSLNKILLSGSTRLGIDRRLFTTAARPLIKTPTLRGNRCDPLDSVHPAGDSLKRATNCAALRIRVVLS